jgi:hypothetical protein
MLTFQPPVSSSGNPFQSKPSQNVIAFRFELANIPSTPIKISTNFLCQGSNPNPFEKWAKKLGWIAQMEQQ